MNVVRFAINSAYGLCYGSSGGEFEESSFSCKFHLQFAIIKAVLCLESFLASRKNEFSKREKPRHGH
jgi:hypothetical protein